MRVVLDASIAVKSLLREPGSDQALQLYRDADEVLAPDWLQAEYAAVLTKYVRRRLLPAEEAPQLLDDLGRLAVTYHPFTDLLPLATQLSLDVAHPLYDCLYLALALAEECPLATSDEVLAEAAGRAGIEIEMIGR